MRLRLVAFAGLAATAMIALPGHAGGQAPQVTDPKGDELAAQANSDIVSVTFDTTGKGKGKTYVPDHLVVTLETASAPSTSSPYVYEVDGSANGCDVSWSYAPGTQNVGSVFFFGCGDPSTTPGDSTPSSLLDLTPKIDGNKVIWSLSLKAIPKEIKVGSTFSGLGALTYIGDPVFGLIGTNLLPAGQTDTASGTTTYKIH